MDSDSPVFDRHCGTLTVGDKVVHLSEGERDLVARLTESPGEFVSLDALADAVYGRADDAPEDAIGVVRVMVCRIRSQSKANGFPEIIDTKPRFGYRLRGAPVVAFHISASELSCLRVCASLAARTNPVAARAASNALARVVA